MQVTGSSQTALETAVKKGCYDAVFGEDFFFPVDQPQSQRPGSSPG